MVRAEPYAFFPKFFQRTTPNNPKRALPRSVTVSGSEAATGQASRLIRKLADRAHTRTEEPRKAQGQADEGAA